MMLTRFVAVLALSAAPALAQTAPGYTAEQIEAFFAPALECPEGQVCAPRGAQRAVCIGTTSACAADAAAAAAPDPGAFDMLITFDLGSDRLSPQAQENLAEFAKALQSGKLSETSFNIDGHTDARGSDSLNMNLSNRRAEAVVNYLESLGIPRSRLVAQGHGESQPRVDDPFADINRRVEATLRIE